MKKLGEGLKELKQFATSQEEQQYQPTRYPRATRDKTTNQRIYMEGPMAPAAYVPEDGNLVLMGREALSPVKAQSSSVGE